MQPQHLGQTFQDTYENGILSLSRAEGYSTNILAIQITDDYLLALNPDNYIGHKIGTINYTQRSTGQEIKLNPSLITLGPIISYEGYQHQCMLVKISGVISPLLPYLQLDFDYTPTEKTTGILLQYCKETPYPIDIVYSYLNSHLLCVRSLEDAASFQSSWQDWTSDGSAVIINNKVASLCSLSVITKFYWWKDFPLKLYKDFIKNIAFPFPTGCPTDLIPIKITSTVQSFQTIIVKGTATPKKGMQVRVKATGGLGNNVTDVKDDGTWEIGADYNIHKKPNVDRYLVIITADQIKGKSPSCNQDTSHIWVTIF